MGMHLQYLNREMKSEVMYSLVSLISNVNLNSEKISESAYLKKFILESYKVNRNERPSVSQLSDIFRKYECEKPGSLAALYGQRLELMASKNNNNDFWV